MFEYILREIILSVIAFLAGAGVSAGRDDGNDRIFG